MVVMNEKMNGGTRTPDHHHEQQTARIIQWLGGERAVDVPAEFDFPPTFKEDTVDHHLLASKVECIELLRLKPLSQQKPRNPFERASLLRRSSRRSRSSTDAQITDEAYCTLSSHRSGFKVKEREQKTIHEHLLLRQGSNSDRSSLSTNIPHCTSSPVLTISVDDFYNHIDRIQTMMNIDHDQGLQRIDPSMDLFREIIFNGERDFHQMIEEFIQIIEKKLADAQYQMFETSPARASSPSLFDMLNDLKSCLTLLRRPEMQSFLQTFDHVLKLRFYPSALPEQEEMISQSVDSPSPIKLNNSETNEELLKLSQYAIDELKIVKIEKNHEPLGLTISRSDCGTIHIARIVVGGIAANTQLFQVHDRILEINDEPITGRSLDYVCTLMSNSTGLMKFLLAPPIYPHPSHSSFSSSTFYVRALYGYDPLNDPLIPCKELGLAFQRGDILRIVARDENSLPLQPEQINCWWQAYRENAQETDTDPSLAGLIPSDDLQQKRAALIKAMSDETDSICSTSTKSKDRKRKQCFTCLPKHERKAFHSVYNNATFVRDQDDTEPPTIRTSTNHFSLTDTRQCGEEQPRLSSTSHPNMNDETKESMMDIPSLHSFRFYEPVFRLDLTHLKITRPIVLLGAPNVGRHELRRRLLQSEPHLFDVAIPHTTRARRLQEIPDVDYHFVSEADFLGKVSRHAFVEFGQFDRDLYGTSIEDIRHVVEVKRKICILNLNPDAIRTFDRTDLLPYIICIAAPSFERLKRLDLDRREHLTDDDYREIIRQSRSLERHHSLLFDTVLINNDLDRTYVELRDLIIRIQHDDQQWVRASYRQT